MKRLGFFGGLHAFVRGAGWVISTPSAWPLAAVPVLVALALATLFVGGGVWGAFAASESLRHGGSALGAAGGWALTVVLVVAAVVVGWLVAITLAQPVSGPALDGLSRRVEASLGGQHRPDGPFWETVWRGLRVTLAGLAVGLPLIAALTVIGLVIPGAVVVTVPLKFVVAALLLSWDLMDYPFGLRGMRVRERVAFMRANLGAVLGFGLACSAVMLIPAVGLLVLPLGVAGATRLVVATEREPPSTS